MTWIPRSETAKWEPPAGLGPWRQMDDSEFDRLSERFGRGVLLHWYERAPGPNKAKAAKAVGGSH